MLQVFEDSQDASFLRTCFISSDRSRDEEKSEVKPINQSHINC